MAKQLKRKKNRKATASTPNIQTRAQFKSHFVIRVSISKKKERKKLEKRRSLESKSFLISLAPLRDDEIDPIQNDHYAINRCKLDRYKYRSEDECRTEVLRRVPRPASPSLLAHRHPRQRPVLFALWPPLLGIRALRQRIKRQMQIGTPRHLQHRDQLPGRQFRLRHEQRDGPQVAHLPRRLAQHQPGPAQFGPQGSLAIEEGKPRPKLQTAQW